MRCVAWPALDTQYVDTWFSFRIGGFCSGTRYNASLSLPVHVDISCDYAEPSLTPVVYVQHRMLAILTHITN